MVAYFVVFFKNCAVIQNILYKMTDFAVIWGRQDVFSPFVRKTDNISLKEYGKCGNLG